jgi:uncharacterized repeat protein (TIGR04138 family)
MSQQKQQQPREPKEVDWKRLADTAGPYPVEAFLFVREGLSYASQRVRDEAYEQPPDQDRHITGQQLCMGLRDFAIDRYGMLAPAVLGHWHIRRTEDFGRIVFAMVEHGLLSKTNDDSLDDFRCVYDFREAFSANEVGMRIGAN